MLKVPDKLRVKRSMEPVIIPFTLFYLTQYPDMQKNLHEEIDQVLEGRLPTFEGFHFTPETALIPISKRDDLKVEEIKFVITLLNGDPTLPKNSEDWSKENLEALKITLQNFFIRYFPHSGRPISTFELLSSSPFSTMINQEHVAELSSWIDRKSTTYSLSSIPHKFQLILLGISFQKILGDE
ncbi:hypothetical protein Glove_300g77 [Diversispora epigaea]|uniref:Uncharacterized protein n=1 Tax=Diversispora epigaea TaxID=1348612 RepID=A0A397HXS5_9GLOM|nr:hypothetical protein Glove_300g77 [Diversispora epigaea]